MSLSYLIYPLNLVYTLLPLLFILNLNNLYNVHPPPPLSPPLSLSLIINFINLINCIIIITYYWIEFNYNDPLLKLNLISSFIGFCLNCYLTLIYIGLLNDYTTSTITTTTTTTSNDFGSIVSVYDGESLEFNHYNNTNTIKSKLHKLISPYFSPKTQNSNSEMMIFPFDTTEFQFQDNNLNSVDNVLKSPYIDKPSTSFGSTASSILISTGPILATLLALSPVPSNAIPTTNIIIDNSNSSSITTNHSLICLISFILILFNRLIQIYSCLKYTNLINNSLYYLFEFIILSLISIIGLQLEFIYIFDNAWEIYTILIVDLIIIITYIISWVNDMNNTHNGNNQYNDQSIKNHSTINT
ncbi:hypothetical protein CANARDRAFT_20076 [[Candida] arabinofermentans NRRL YB-2248]|uniref:Uncharacterized protein n=1 Tax=[Candida] arabinofermentans NRRL YB-2248 TaxID=983967 RepID=A0A1E4STM5_9ASCO|nr:hypothetical protein CANARDRAFT_20076 [[Candida] arabinofermentans NRRL YB-2248]